MHIETVNLYAMVLNSLNMSNNTDIQYKGKFNDVVTTINTGKTLLPTGVFEVKSTLMDKQLIKELLCSRFNNDVELLSDATGIPVADICNILSGVDSLTNTEHSGSGDYIQIGDRIEVSNTTGDGQVNNYGEMPKETDVLKQKNKEIAELKKIISAKDDLILALKDTIELLKSK